MRTFVIICAILLSISVNSQETERPRTVLLEGFTASTCPPCVAGNQNIKNILFQNDGSYVLVKYQMNFPTPGDPYYTTEFGTRGSFYGLPYVPYLAVDGPGFLDNSQDLTSAKLEELQAVPSNMEIEIDYAIEGKTVSATVTINPAMNISGNNLRLFIVIVERLTFKNKGTNGEDIFSQVIKKFMPNSNGIVLGDLTANTPAEFQEEWEFKGEYRLPLNASSPINHNIEHSIEDFENLAVVAWVQNMSTKSVLQSCQKSNKKLVAFKTLDSNGTVHGTFNGEIKNKEFLVNEGEDVVITATPNGGFVVKNWKINGNIVPDNITNELVLQNIDKDVYVSVEFLRIGYNVKHSVQNNIGGIITAETADGETVEDDDYVLIGSRIIFTATPAQGFRILAWRLNGTIQLGYTDNEFVVESLNNDVNVTIEFQATHFNVNFSVFNEFGTISAKVNDVEIESGDLIARGSRVVFMAAPDENFKVSEWKNNGITIFGNTTPEFIVNSLTNTANVTVRFSHESKFMVFTEVNPTDAGMVTGGEGLFDPNEEVTVTASPKDGWLFVNWTKSGVIMSLNDVYKFNITEDVTLVANFEIIPEEFIVIVKANNDAYGEVDGGGIYTDGTETTIKATANDGYIFVNWVEEGGEEFATTEIYTFTVERNITLVANFDVLEKIKSENLSELVIYPNPVRDILSVESDLDIISIEIINLQGQKIIFSNKKEIDVSRLSSGVYLVFVNTNEGIVVNKVIKK